MTGTGTPTFLHFIFGLWGGWSGVGGRLTCNNYLDSGLTSLFCPKMRHLSLERKRFLTWMEMVEEEEGEAAVN